MSTEPIKGLEGLSILQEQKTESVPLFAPEIVTPPDDWRDKSEMQFHCFVFHKHEDNCINCGAVHHWADVYRAFVRKSGMSTRRLVPYAHKIPDDASIVIFNIPARKVPVCVSCLTSGREGAQVYLVSDEAAWNEAMRREQENRLNSRRAETARRNSGNPHVSMDLNSVPSDI